MYKDQKPHHSWWHPSSGEVMVVDINTVLQSWEWEAEKRVFRIHKVPLEGMCYSKSSGQSPGFARVGCRMCAVSVLECLHDGDAWRSWHITDLLTWVVQCSVCENSEDYCQGSQWRCCRLMVWNQDSAVKIICICQWSEDQARIGDPTIATAFREG